MVILSLLLFSLMNAQNTAAASNNKHCQDACVEDCKKEAYWPITCKPRCIYSCSPGFKIMSTNMYIYLPSKSSHFYFFDHVFLLSLVAPIVCLFVFNIY